MSNANSERRTFRFPACDFGAGAICAKVEFSRAENADLATIYLEETPIGVVALNNKDARDIAYCNITKRTKRVSLIAICILLSLETNSFAAPYCFSINCSKHCSHE